MFAISLFRGTEKIMPADFLQKLCEAEDKVNPEDLPSKNTI